jgi:hypothetical protein
MDQKTKDMIEAARARVMTPEELERQRISFAYGNAPYDESTTKQTVRAALTESKITRTS